MKQIRILVAFFATMAGLTACLPAVAADFSHQQICKAAIGKIMGRDPKTMTVSKSEAGIVYLHYIRKNDQSRWAYRCRLEGQQIVWATETGRWRNDPRDEKLSYVVKGDSIEITESYTNMPPSKETFKAAQLGK